MKNVKILCASVFLIGISSFAGPPEGGFWGGLPTGPFTPGFRLVKTSDASRSFPADGTAAPAPRPLRIYIWYPATKDAGVRMRLDDYVRMALEDFRPSVLPVPLTKGIDDGAFMRLRGVSTEAVRDAAAATGRFPLIVFGQGLFYESPLSHFVVCEFLAAHGYVVASSPLLGARVRLVNIDVEDVETEVRDMESVMAEARSLSFTDPERLGVIGYDLGGMAGLIMAMRNPDVDGFLSLDSGILDKHASGLPATHPQYREEGFRIPWMHMTQARFIRTQKDRVAEPSLFERKAYGPSYLVHVPTANHGQFSSYAALGLTKAVPGYWGPSASDPKPPYEEICRLSLAFFASCLRQDHGPLKEQLQSGADPASDGPPFKIEYKKGRIGAATGSELVHLIISKGIRQAVPAIESVRAAQPGVAPIEESVLNWLGLHFLYWWGREEEAVGVFELSASLYPDSWRAHDSLGEAYAEQGRTDAAIRSYKRSLDLNPENQNAKAALKRLSTPAKKGFDRNGAG